MHVGKFRPYIGGSDVQVREVREAHAAGEGEGLARPRLEGCQMRLRLEDVHEDEAPASQACEGDITRKWPVGLRVPCGDVQSFGKILAYRWG